MPFVNVRLVAPNGKRYRVDIDSDLSVEAVKSQLVQQLQKLQQLGVSPDKKYTLLLVESFSLSPGDEVRLVEAADQAVRDMVPDD